MPVYQYLRKTKNPMYPAKVDKEYIKNEKKNTPGLERCYYVWYYYAGAYVDVNGTSIPYKKRGFQSPKDADKAEQEFLDSSKNSLDFRMTLDELFTEYMEYSKLHKDETTCNKDKGIYKVHIKERYGSLRVLSITTNQLVSKYNELFAMGYKHGTVMNVHKTFNKLFNYADRMYSTDHNPASRVGAPKNKEVKEEIVTRSYEDFGKLYEQIERLDHKTIFMIFYFTGVRRGELVGLRWNDYNNGKLRIDESVANLEGGPKAKQTKTKRSYRTISINSELCNLLDELYKVKSKEDAFHEKAFIFGSVHRPMAFETLRQAHVRYEQKAGLPHIRIHDYRHSHISNLIAAKMPITAVAARVGDSLKVIMEVYAHLLKESEEEVDNFLEENVRTFMKTLPKLCQNQKDIKKSP